MDAADEIFLKACLAASRTLLSIAPAVEQLGRAGQLYVMGGEGSRRSST